MTNAAANQAGPNAAAPPLPPLPKLLRGQKALVTGANSGIGKAVALALAEAGADVGVNYVVEPDKAEEAAAAARAFGVNAKIYQGDVSSEADVNRMVAQFIADFGALDIVVANAGLQRDASIATMTLDQWNKVLSVNLTGQFLCARAAIAQFRAQGDTRNVSRSRGKIICMSSVHQMIPWAGHVNYASSKGGVMLMMQSLAQECAPDRIRVNSIAPGAIRTPINHDAWATQDAYDNLMKLIPYGRIGEPEDIGKVAAWLASDYCDYIVGATLFVDGGMTLFPGFATNG
ncbi:MAG: glucose 1-dehydrogenase [Pseudomonadota bacterium]|nr:glucose 1-dehydrogenase [Pseudomonadota bacterium]